MYNFEFDSKIHINMLSLFPLYLLHIALLCTTNQNGKTGVNYIDQYPPEK